MSTSHFVFRVVCMICFMTSLVSSTREGLTQELIKHILQIPNPDKVLNTVLWRLEQNREMTKNSELFAQDADCEDPTEERPEYTESLESSRERELRQLGAQKHYPICHVERAIQRLNTDKYEYRPAYYEEIRCVTISNNDRAYKHEICPILGFTCFQWNKTIHLTRRLYSSECWESETRVIPAGCECMWPVHHHLGDIPLHVRA